MPTDEKPPSAAPPPATSGPPDAPPPPARRARLRLRRPLVWAAALAVAAALAYLGLRPSPVEVEVRRVERGPLLETVDEEGVTRVRDRFTLTAPVPGRLLRMTLREGDPLATGAVVARIAAPPLDPRAVDAGSARVAAARAAVARADAEVESAAAALAQARREAARAAELAPAAVSRQDAERAALAAETRARELEGARADAAAAAGELLAAREALLDAAPQGPPQGRVVEVRAPGAGRVLRVHDRSERTVGPGDSIAEVGDARVLEVVVDVLSTDAVRIEPGMRVVLEGWGGGAPLSGHVRSVGASATTKVSALGVEEQRVDIVVSLPDPPAALGDGFRVDARFVVWETESALLVPAGALFREPGGRWAVFVVERGRARRRAVETGRRGEAGVEVRAGLRAGEAVVVYPSDRVSEGARIRPERGS